MLARDIVVCAPGRAALAVVLLLTAGVTEAFGLLMIVPLLHVAGVADGGGESGGVVDVVVSVATRFGIPLSLPWLLGAFLALAAVRAGSGWARTVVTTRLHLDFSDRVRAELYGAVAGASWGYLLGQRRSDIQHMLSVEVGRVGNAAFALVQIVVGGTLASIQFAVACAVAPTIGAFAALLGLVVAVTARVLMRRPRSLGQRQTGAGLDLRGHVTDFLDGLKVAKVHNQESAHLERIVRDMDDLRERQMDFTKFTGATRAGLQFAAAAALVGLVWYALSATTLTPPELLLLALVFARLTPAALNLLQQTQHIANALPAYEAVARLRGELEEGAEVEASGSPMPPRWRNDVDIEARDVEFVYSGMGTPALAGVSFRIAPKELFVVTGHSGSGKSTLAALLLGLLPPSRGEILVGGEPLRDATAKLWRNSTAFLAESPFLLHESIRTNLSWAHPDATEEAMWGALRQASADFVATLPQGLDTVVGDRGERLSGGERQRIALAAALLRRPALLVLDEPTGQLDPENEARVVEALCGLRGQTTMVVIAHDGPLLAEADRLLVLHFGQVKSIGP